MTPEQQAEFDALEAADSGGNLSIAQGNEMADRDAYRETFDEAGPVDQFMSGVGKAPMQLYYGAKDALGLSDAEDQQTLNMMEEQHGLAAGAGEVVGDVALSLLPAGAVAKGVGAATKGAPALLRAGSILGGESLLAGGIEGTKAPEAGETRLDNATEAAKWSLALGAPFAAASSYAPKVGAEAKKLLDAGVRLTPGMAGGKARTGLEKFMGNIPGLGGKVSKMQDTAIGDWNKYLLNKVNPGGDEITDIGHEGFKQVQDRFKREYTDIWDKVTPETFKLDKFDGDLANARGLLKALPEGDARTATRALDALESSALHFSNTGQAGVLESTDDALRELAGDAATNGNMLLGNYYAELRAALRHGVGGDVSKRLTKADKLYRDFKTVEQGASYVKAQEADAVINPRQLESAVKARNTPAATTKGKGSMQGDASDATKSIGNVLSGRSEISVGPDIGKWGTLLGIGATGVAPGLAVLGGTRASLNEGMRKFLTGVPLGEFKLPARIARMMRLAGVSSIDQIEDPVFKQQVIQEAEKEMAANQE